MRTTQQFDSFFETVNIKAAKLDFEEPILPIKRRRPIYSILQLIEVHYETARKTEGFYPETTAHHYRFIYHDALDTVVMSLKDLFEQQSYQFFLTIEQLLLKSINYEP